MTDEENLDLTDDCYYKRTLL